MPDEEKLVAEQVIGTMTVRISQHTEEEFWRVDVSGRAAGSTSTTVASGDNFMMTLIEGAVSGEPVAWRHLAQWGQDALGRATLGRRIG